jgi:hypothetical protein
LAVLEHKLKTSLIIKADRAFIISEVLQSVIDRHGLHFAVSEAHSLPSHSTCKHLRDLTPTVNMIEEFVTKTVVWQAI